MAITYKKPLKTIKVYVRGQNSAIEVADTATEAKATMAYAEFERGFKMHLPTQSGTTVVPYHAVEMIEVSAAASDDITKADPYCADADTESE